MKATQVTRRASQAWELEQLTVDVLPPCARAIIARDVLLEPVLQQRRVQDMHLRHQPMRAGAQRVVPKPSLCGPVSATPSLHPRVLHTWTTSLNPWYGIPQQQQQLPTHSTHVLQGNWLHTTPGKHMSLSSHLEGIRALWKHRPVPLVKLLLKLLLHHDEVGGVVDLDANLGLQPAEAGETTHFTWMREATTSTAMCSHRRQVRRLFEQGVNPTARQGQGQWDQGLAGKTLTACAASGVTPRAGPYS